MPAEVHEGIEAVAIEMSGPTEDNMLTSMAQSPEEQAWGCFTHPQITYVDRLKILHTAKTLVAWHTNISWTGGTPSRRTTGMVSWTSSHAPN